MSGSAGRLANPLGPGVPVPGGGSADMPPPPPSGGPPMGAGAGGALGAGSPMGPPGGPSGGGMGMMPSSLEGAKKALQQQNGQARAAFQQTGKALNQIDHMRKGLERLSDKGDMVRPEDVIHEASKLVAHGIDPMALAGVLADMPQQGGGEALGGWVMGHAIQAVQTEQMLMKAHAVARHDLGISAMHLLAAHAVGDRMTPVPPPEEMDGGNALVPGTSDDEPPPAISARPEGAGPGGAPPPANAPRGPRLANALMPLQEG